MIESNRWNGIIGWCHSCGTVQMGDEARWLPMAWDGNRPDWACVTCDDEPWGLGVWDGQLGYEEAFTPAATAWLNSDAGRAWQGLDECDDCGARHHNPADCGNPPDGDDD